MNPLRFQRHNLFTKKPLNYETFTKRLDSWAKHSSPSEPISPHLLNDFIIAGRTLQREKLSSRSSHTLTSGRSGSSYGKDFLKIRRDYTISEIEGKVVAFLKQNQTVVTQNESTIKTYLLSKPVPTNPNVIIEFIKANFLHQLRNGSRNRSAELLKIAIRLLLQDKDYENVFKLIDSTIASKEGIAQSNRNTVIRAVTGVSMISSVSLFVIWNYSIFIGVLWIFVAGGLKYGFQKINRVMHLSRVSWRPHCGWIYKNSRDLELYLMNHIITHYEEHSEVNVRNFHHSEVRTISKLNMFERNDYVLELPEIAGEETANQTEMVTAMDLTFREQLNKRRMVLNDLQEELMFLDFWLAQGENYEWVEPDQDPAEIIKLKTQDSSQSTAVTTKGES